MKRTQVYLADGEYEALREASFKARVSISALIRRLVDQHLLGHRSRRKTPQGLLALAGLIHETKPDVATRHDEYLWGDAA
ncbi:MAG: hypothetical protein HY600_02755 [Candidatus Omnitrophica bacterium]|nr:hypothetical protein [Candidatus Omnitrophota bacterium]